MNHTQYVLKKTEQRATAATVILLFLFGLIVFFICGLEFHSVELRQGIHAALNSVFHHVKKEDFPGQHQGAHMVMDRLQ